MSLSYSFCDGLTSTVESCSKWSGSAPWRSPYRQFQNDFILVVFDGSMHIKLDGQKTLLETGQILMLPAGVLHDKYMDSKTPRMHAISLHFHIANAFGFSPLLFFKNRIHQLPISSDFWIRQFLLLAEISGKNRAAAANFASSLIGCLLTNLASAGSPMKDISCEEDPRIHNELSVIHSRYSEASLSVETIAREQKMSAVGFRKLFSKHMKITPKKYLDIYRVKMAAARLKSTTLSIKEISGSCGYSDVHYFHLRFKSHFGKTPLKYRRSPRQEI